MIINRLDVGQRVWTVFGFRDHGKNKATIPPQMGGVVTSSFNEFITISNPLFTVKWDGGQQGTHYGSQLVCIGKFQTLAEFEQAVVVAAERVKKVIGPKGGVRAFTLLLRDGDTVEGCQNLEPLLQKAHIPIETEIIPRKPRHG